MARFASVLWDTMGWCPMEEAFTKPAVRTSGIVGQVQESRSHGRISRRSPLHMRLAWGVVILSWVVAFLVLPYLPDVIEVHWDVHGVADGFADRFTGAFGLPLIITLVMGILIILPRFDSMQIKLTPLRDIYAFVILAVISMLFCIEVITLAVALGVDLPVVTVIPVVLGFLFVILGRVLPFIDRNTTVGIRLPWTLASEEIWKKTHEYGGNLITLAGILIIFGSLVSGTWAIALMLVIIFGVFLYISVWSYLLAKRENEDKFPGM
ncbi:putative membrane protein [Methanolinea mesophila]|uniref:SdpI family protein n=1 Tax=Methanolinea mesophila TaxID=547055 RepID=UPI001AEA5B0C|nr:SdpI family protein [Methanolinea mesophila]MBP1929473.1 putative membrane protein [Methanolinea mesophila]